MNFPIDLTNYKPLTFSTTQQLTSEQEQQLAVNIQLVRDTIVFMTGLAAAKGLGGHTGGPYDIVPEALIMDSFMRGTKNVSPIFFDEAGHRVALQYVLAALDKNKPLSLKHLLHYREANHGLYGHPELDPELGIDFSSGRLGHLWGEINGLALRTNKKTILFGSDGAQQEGNDAEAARFAVAHNLPIILLIDDNNITIEGHPHDYLPGYDLSKTLTGHGLTVKTLTPNKNQLEPSLQQLHSAIKEALLHQGPYAIINKRTMAPGLLEIQGTPKAHDVISPELAVKYLQQRNHTEAITTIQSVAKIKPPRTYKGSTEERGSNRNTFGTVITKILTERGPKEQQKIKVFSADLGGSTGVNEIEKKYPSCYIKGGVMERGLFLAAAGFGSQPGYQGIFATFSAFSEMINSEIKMTRLNHRNVLVHFSHAGMDWIADNTCHFGDNVSFLDNGLGTDTTRLYFPADPLQMEAIIKTIYDDPGLRFVFSTRSKVPYILNEKGKKFFQDYKFTGKDELIRPGKDGYIVTYGELLYRCLAAVEELKEEGFDIGLINKPLLNIPDKDMLKTAGKSPLVLFVESQNQKTGFGNRYASWLLESGYTPKFAHLAATKLGAGGVYEHIPHQSLDPKSIKKKVHSLLK